MKRKAGSQVGGNFKRARSDLRQLDVVMADQQRRKSQALVGLTQELKFNDTAFNTDATTTGAIIALSTFAAGDTSLLRDGNKILVRSFELRVRLELEAVTQNAVCRFLLVRDKNANIAAPPTIAGSIITAVSPEALREIAYMSRYDVLMDKTITINEGSGAVQKAFFKKYIKVPQDQALTSFSDGTAAIPVSNSYSLIYLSDVAAGATDVNVFGNCRMRFVG